MPCKRRSGRRRVVGVRPCQTAKKPDELPVSGPLLCMVVAHGATVNLLWSQTRSPAEGCFQCVHGAQSRVVIDAGAIGITSTVPRAFATAGSVLFPSAVCVLADCLSELRRPERPCPCRFAARGRHAQCGRARVFLPCPNGGAPGSMLSPASWHPRAARLLSSWWTESIDHCTASATPTACRRMAQHTLANLARLGNQTTGLFSTFLCGAAAAIACLLTRNDTTRVDIPDGVECCTVRL